jgi:predicted Mrr-cat superfamily restriction endonuclease
MENNTYVVRCENGKWSENFRDKEVISLGWFTSEVAKLFDLTKAGNRSYIKELMSDANPDKSIRSIGIIAGMVYRFINELSVGDKIISPYGKKFMYGTVISECFIETEDTNIGVLQRKVKWHEDLDRDVLSENIKSKLYCNLTFFSIDELNLGEVTDGTSYYNTDTTELEDPYDYDDEVDEEIYEENIITQGIVYILKSTWCEGIVKPGKSNVEYFEKRMYDLSIHNCFFPNINDRKVLTETIS